MNAPEDAPSPTSSERPCGITAFIPLGMSCRGRAEAFARRLQSRLRTLGSQSGDGEEANGTSVEGENGESTWLTQDEAARSVTSLQPLRNQEGADSFFDFDMEPESPGSPIDECEYSRLIETTTHTPQPQDMAPESGYVCASPASAEGSLASHSSSDGPYFDPEGSETDRSLTSDYHDCIGSHKQKEGAVATIFENVHNGTLKMRPPTGTANKVRVNGGLHPAAEVDENDSGSSDSLPPSQSTPTLSSSNNADGSESTITGSKSNSTLLDETEGESDEVAQENVKNGMCRETEIEDIQQTDLVALKELITGNGNGHVHHEEEQETGEQQEKETPLTNGHVENGVDEVDHSIVARRNEDEEVNTKNELIILECLRVIDATPEASPEPESRTDDVQEPSGDKLKVEDGADGDTDGDTDGMDDRPQRVRRCSSLKTGKTPPGTPGRKKIVRFADVLGLDLAAVRTFMDEMPKIPKSAYEDLDLPEPGAVSVSLGPRVDKVLMPLFQQPGALAGFLDIIRDKHVSLENAAVTDPVTMTISGSVRVRNLDFHKSVYVRYTTDSWRTYSDLQASYVDNSCDGFSDKFKFTVFGNALQVGERIEIAVRFHCKGQILWDNNFGANYCFQCLPVSTPNRPATAPADVQVDAWHGASFY